MSYVQSTLLPGERIVYEGRVSLWSEGPSIIIGIPMFLFCALSMSAGGTVMPMIFGILGIMVLGTAFIAYRTTELAVTSKRVVAKFGVLRRQTVELNLARVESVQVDQGLMGGIFDFGSLVVAGAGVPSAPIPGVSNPMMFRRMVFQAQEDSDRGGMLAPWSAWSPRGNYHHRSGGTALPGRQARGRSRGA
ncbi:PH domain-containing protein [Paraburkholderia saeva]|uniref:PH domain-containing protein n=1 Tax=Paraburkholderia saeva TaxID=2777537 RepID=UPI001D42D87F|nr:PH domain-containing protein [Paraburkholderia saeva]CAG4906552.1 hypothetical protein R70241_03431 [Paraburkholderia saeva]